MEDIMSDKPDKLQGRPEGDTSEEREMPCDTCRKQIKKWRYATYGLGIGLVISLIWALTK